MRARGEPKHESNRFGAQNTAKFVISKTMPGGNPA